MKARTKEAAGRLLFWCSHFAAYIMPDKCDAERRIGHGDISKRRAGKRGKLVAVSGEESLDLDGVVAQRRACLSCPGVCERSMAELREGKLSL